MESVGIDVIDCSCQNKSALRYLMSFGRFLKHQSDCDAILVGFLGHFFMPFVRLFSRKKILLDVFVSIYQTMAFDRQSIRPLGPLAAAARWLDKTACQLADHVFCDTQQHIDYFVREYGLPREKFSRLFVGADKTVMCPRPDAQGAGHGASGFLVHFHGEFQPLHGVEYIIGAAALLPDVQFHVIGKGGTYTSCLQKAKELNLKNMQFIPPVPYERLPEYMNMASVCLGIFGDTAKAQMVIPHKVFEALAMGKPLITADTPAARELVVDKESVLFCKKGSAASLAEAITKLKNDAALRQCIAENGHRLFNRICAPHLIGEQLRKSFLAARRL
jgi:glycosyltransferase involved in cell wall biosynthesis